MPPPVKIFTNGDEAHAARALTRLGLEGCFDGIICFETVNPPARPSPSYDPTNAANIFDIVEHLSRPDAGAGLPETPILCKPSEDAMVQALKIAGINPRTAVSQQIFFPVPSRTNQKNLQSESPQQPSHTLSMPEYLSADVLRRQRPQHPRRQADRSTHRPGEPSETTSPASASAERNLIGSD